MQVDKGFNHTGRVKSCRLVVEGASVRTSDNDTLVKDSVSRRKKDMLTGTLKSFSQNYINGSVMRFCHKFLS